MVGHLDLDPAAQPRAPSREGLARLELGDAKAMLFSDGEFTLVVTSNAFFFFEEPLEVLGDAYRVLAPGGPLAIATAPEDLRR